MASMLILVSCEIWKELMLGPSARQHASTATMIIKKVKDEAKYWIVVFLENDPLLKDLGLVLDACSKPSSYLTKMTNILPYFKKKKKLKEKNNNHALEIFIYTRNHIMPASRSLPSISVRHSLVVKHALFRLQ